MKIGVSSWSLHKEFFNGRLNIIDFIRIAKEEFDVDAIEIVHWMAVELSPEKVEKLKSVYGQIAIAMADRETPEGRQKIHAAWGAFGALMTELSTNKPENLEAVKNALEKYGVQVLNMPIDYGNISQLDDEKRKADLAIIKNWIDVAAFLGSKGARVNTGSQPEGVFDLSITADSYRELAEYAETKGIALVLENHGGMSADPRNILKLFEMVSHPYFRICPDFGNFEASIRYEALEMIFNNPILVHAKTYDFDENGNHPAFDYDRCMNIAKENNYDGYYSIEFEGQGEQYVGVKKTIELLKRYL